MNEEKYISGAFWYYNIDLSVRYEIQMKDSVDGVLLQKALDTAMVRFPYLKKRLIESTSAFHLVENDLPVVVLNTCEPVHLCAAQTNFHLFAISYFDDSIFFDNSHALFDGRGRSGILHALIYYYCKFKYGEDVEMPGVMLADSPINPLEYEDPYAREIPEPKVALPDVAPISNVMYLPAMGLVRKSKTQIHHVRISEKQLMSLCKSSDATPNTAITLLMCRAIHKLHPESDKSIAAGIYCDLRSCLGIPLTHKPIVAAPLLEYSKDMYGLPFDEQNTIMRGKLMLATDENNLLKTARELKAWSLDVNAMATTQEKIAAAHKMWDDTTKGRTFAVSYSGRSNFGTCDKYLKAFFPQVSAFTMGMLLEITTADGWFYVTFIQEWKEDVYFNAFLKEVVSFGLDFDLLYSSEESGAIFNLQSR
ncbi:MAG: hypothetical protein KBS80_00420 [Bacteroidales bacterium]|nr:hypothetical protein [Candidatus Cryptobacteroides choladohippi]